jgi:hypothetical protein
VTSRALPTLLACLLAALIVPTTARAEDEDLGAKLLASGAVKIRTQAVGEGPVWVGSRAVVRIEFLTKSFFKGAPDLPDLAVRRAIVRRESSTAINGSERIDGVPYASQIWEYAIYPQRVGTLRVPSLDVVLRVAGEDGEVIEVAGRTASAVLEVRLPPGAEGLAFVICAPALRVATTREPEDATFRVGGAFRRTVSVRVEGAPAMLIEPLPAVELEGVAIYPDAPSIEETSVRGDLQGLREESTAYVMERAGSYTLPAVRIPWWNTTTGTLEMAEVPAFAFSVTGGDGPVGGTSAKGSEPAPRATSREAPWPWGWIVGASVFLLIALWLGRHSLAAQVERLRDFRQARADAEPARFCRFEESCRGSDPAAARRSLQHWLDAYGDAHRTATLAGLLDAAQDPALAAAVSELDERLYGRSAGAGVWSGHALASRCAEARRRYRHREARLQSESSGLLNPPLPRT